MSARISNIKLTLSVATLYQHLHKRQKELENYLIQNHHITNTFRYKGFTFHIMGGHPTTLPPDLYYIVDEFLDEYAYELQERQDVKLFLATELAEHSYEYIWDRLPKCIGGGDRTRDEQEGYKRIYRRILLNKMEG